MLLSVDENFKNKTHCFVIKSSLSLFLPQPTRGNLLAMIVHTAFREAEGFYHSFDSAVVGEEELKCWFWRNVLFRENTNRDRYCEALSC